MENALVKKTSRNVGVIPPFSGYPKLQHCFNGSHWHVLCVLICNPRTRAHLSPEQAALLYQSATRNLVQLSVIDNFFSGKTVNKTE